MRHDDIVVENFKFSLSNAAVFDTTLRKLLDYHFDMACKCDRQTDTQN